MRLNLKNPLVFFDLETTGINIVKDRIIEISYVKVFPNGKEEARTFRVNPGMPIPPESTAIHGIKDEDVKDCPTFKEIAKSFASQIEGCDLAGYRFSIRWSNVPCPPRISSTAARIWRTRIRRRPIRWPPTRSCRLSWTVIRS